MAVDIETTGLNPRTERKLLRLGQYALSDQGG